MSADEYPVTVSEGSIKLKTDKMATDQLYHCILEGKVFLFYKDDLGLLHCYEVEDKNAVEEIVKNPSDIENILKKYAGV